MAIGARPGQRSGCFPVSAGIGERFEAGVIAVFAGRPLDRRRPPIFRDGRQTRDYTYVGGILAAHPATAAHPDAHGEYHVGTGGESSAVEGLAPAPRAGLPPPPVCDAAARMPE